ncbi:TIGR02594 family protein [Caldovatus aquaticus]|uniref:TIGR02594 family protein n=1 Tax=Caldovatus aquaticus TaxID=2865671 RepID=A0ABS7F783_9PROT|nr:TIGR02594 family protein [Caldovatus aquaticus]MBW8271470.1 TIGR02594 family protein [Caldovatus aquaticus]
MARQPLFRETTGWAVRSLRRAMGVWAGACLGDGDLFDAALGACVRQFRRAYGLPAGDHWEFPPCCGSPLLWWGTLCPAGIATPFWFDIAMCEIGEQEGSGKAVNNPRIVEYLQQFAHLNRSGLSAVDETAWCGAFVAWCLQQAGVASNDFLNGKYLAGAKMWLHVGKKLGDPVPGCVAVVHNAHAAASTTATGWHVGLYVDGDRSGVWLLGGNQGNKVCVAPFLRAKGWSVEGYRWPSGMTLPAPGRKGGR